MREPHEAPILIVGTRRSGTTLLRTMLAGHPSLLVHRDEPQFLLGLARRYGRILDRDSGIDFLLAHPYHEPSVTREGLTRRLPPGPTTLPRFARTYLNEWQEAVGSSGARLVLKQPQLVFHLDLVLDMFPGAVIVNMVRDPRANVASQIARWPRMSLWTAVAWWRRALHAAARFQRSYAARMLSIRYEDLVLAPESTLVTLCRRLGIPYSQSLLTFDMETSAYALSSPGAAVPVRYSRPEPARSSQWQGHMSPATICLIEQLCLSEMDQWGYPAMQPEVQRRAVAKRALIECIRWASLRVTGAVRRARQLR